MTEAALFYEAANAGLGDDFLDDIQHAPWPPMAHSVDMHAEATLPVMFPCAMRAQKMAMLTNNTLERIASHAA